MYWRIGLFLGTVVGYCFMGAGCYAKCFDYAEAKAKWPHEDVWWHGSRHCWNNEPVLVKSIGHGHHHRDCAAPVELLNAARHQIQQFDPPRKPIANVNQTFMVLVENHLYTYGMGFVDQLPPDKSTEAWILRSQYELQLGLAGGAAYSFDKSRQNNGVSHAKETIKREE